jgi:hypothetical protein
MNATRHSTGHVWQGRFYSCSLDEQHLWEALRYTELKSGSSRFDGGCRAVGVIQRRGRTASAGLLTMDPWQAKWSVADWRTFLSAGIASRVWLRHGSILTPAAL